MAPERRKLLLLAALIVGMAVIFALRVRPGTTAATSSTSNTRGRAAAGTLPLTAPDVRLEALDLEHPKPDGIDRNLFRFREAPPARPVAETSRPSPPPTGPGPAPPAGIAPISLKFVGYVTREEDGQKIASLSDGRGGPFLGMEGTIVLGRYKIWRIGEESIELSYLDGTGRTTIRLTGQ